MRIRLDGPQQCGQFVSGDVGVVLGGFGLQKAVEALQRVMYGATRDAGKVIDLLAGAAHPACLLDDAQPLHAL
ncbi:hypothetical protein D3C76_1623760 [compost metagenome]